MELLQFATAQFITKCDGLLLQIATAFLLQSARRFITNCDRYYKVRWLLQIATVSCVLSSPKQLRLNKNTRMFSLSTQGGRGRLETHQSFIHLLQNFSSLLTTCTVKIILSWYCKFTVSKNISEKPQNHDVFSTLYCHKMQLLAFLDLFTTEIPFLILHPVKSLSLSYKKPEKSTLLRRSLRLLYAIIVSTPSASQYNRRCCKVIRTTLFLLDIHCQ